MRRTNFIFAVVAALWVLGCQEQLPVALTPDQTASALEVKVLPAIDSSLIVEASVDTSGVTQSEEQTYPATFLVNGVKSDLGTSHTSFSYSRILLNNTLNSITVAGKVIGYVSVDVGQAKVNSVDLPKFARPVRTYTNFFTGQNAGSAYALVDKDNAPISDFTFAPRQHYRFVADGRGAVSSFELGIDSPDEVTVVEPKAGSVVFRDRDLQIRWDGKAGSKFRILVSSFNPASNVSVKPLIEVNVTEGSNSIVIPSDLLEGLRANSDGRYLFSFISSNRNVVSIPGYKGNVLVQASSIHNVLLWLR